MKNLILYIMDTVEFWKQISLVGVLGVAVGVLWRKYVKQVEGVTDTVSHKLDRIIELLTELVARK
jgi:hypothetical protein